MIVSELPDTPTLQEHGDVAVLADFEHGPVLRGGQAGQSACALDGPAELERFGGDSQDCSEGDQAPVQVDDDGAVQAGDCFEDGGLDIGEFHSSDDMMKGSLGVFGGEVFGVLGVVADDIGC